VPVLWARVDNLNEMVSVVMPDNQQTRWVEYSYPLREGFTAQLILPANLSDTEAARLCAFLRTLVTPTEA
jgi:hypothetical protein